MPRLPIELRATKSRAALHLFRRSRNPKVSSLLKKVGHLVNVEQPPPKKVGRLVNVEQPAPKKVGHLVKVELPAPKKVGPLVKVERPPPKKVGPLLNRERERTKKVGRLQPLGEPLPPRGMARVNVDFRQVNEVGGCTKFRAPLPIGVDKTGLASLFRELSVAEGTEQST